MQLTDRHIKRIENLVLMRHPILRQAGMYRPDKNGRTILSQGEILPLFYESEDDEKYLVGVAEYIAFKRLQEEFHNLKNKNEDLPHILTQHFELAELVLLHHSKRFPTLYIGNIGYFESKRGEFLKRISDVEDATPEAWMEHAYWLIGRMDSLKETDRESSNASRQQALYYLFKAHKAGKSEATDALATLCYVDFEQRGRAIALWNKAASHGNTMAIQNLSAVVINDDSFDESERQITLRSLWAGISKNKEPIVKQISKQLKASGFTYSELK